MHGQGENAQRGLRLLLVEDDPDHATIAEHFLGKLGSRVDTVLTRDDLAGAREALASGQFDIALLDLTLPDSMLESTVEAIAGLSQLGTSIIAMSSLDVPEVRTRAIELGACEFLAKTHLSAATLAEAFDRISPASAARKAPVQTSGASLTEPIRPRSEPRNIASKIAHDANSWIANAMFRVSALERDEAVAASNVAQDHLASIGISLDALTKFIAGSRALLIDEVSDQELAGVPLDDRLTRLVDIWSAASQNEGVVVESAHLPPSIMATDDGLTSIVAVLLENTTVHGTERETRTIRFEGLTSNDGPGTTAETTIVVTDDGGAWDISRPEMIATPSFRGDPRSPRAGLGLYRVKRWMERFGGRIAFEPRIDVPGAMRILLTFRAP